MTLEEFAPYVGTPFIVLSDETAKPTASLVLTEAERSPFGGADRQPFSLVFSGSADVRLDQGTYWLAREGYEPQPLFLVPIAPGRYEAVFS